METHLGHSTSTEHEKTRNIFFDDPLFEEFALRPLIMDGCPLGEISATASLIEDGDRDGWFREWTAADRVAGYGDASAHADHTISASGAYVRASSYYRAAYLPLYGSPVDPRLVKAFDKEAVAFQKAAAHLCPRRSSRWSSLSRGPPFPGTSAGLTTPTDPGRPLSARTATTR